MAVLLNDLIEPAGVGDSFGKMLLRNVLLTDVITLHMHSLSIPEDAMNNTCLEFRNLSLGYQGHATVHPLSGDVKRGSLTASRWRQQARKMHLAERHSRHFEDDQRCLRSRVSARCLPGPAIRTRPDVSGARDRSRERRRPAVSSAVVRSPRRLPPLTRRALLRIPGLRFCWSPTTASLAENVSMRFIDLGGAGGKAA